MLKSLWHKTHMVIKIEELIPLLTPGEEYLDVKIFLILILLGVLGAYTLIIIIHSFIFMTCLYF